MISQKRSEKQLSAEHTLKSRYLDKEKQKTVPLINRVTKQIKLTDLCPQEKQKVGELIKTLELRRLENEQLNEEIDKIRQNFEESEFQLSQATQQLEQKEQQCHQLNLRIAEFEMKEKEQSARSLKLTLDLVKYKDIASSVKPVKKCNGWTQTDSLDLSAPCQQATQTKKIKTKGKSIQVCEKEQQIIQRSIFYRPHSKSFEKIMKAPLPEHQNSYIRSQNDINSTNRYISCMENEEQEAYQSSQKMNLEQEFEVCQDSLSKKWQKLQERNKKQNSSVSRPTNKFYDEFSQPREFIQVEDTQENAFKKDSHLNSIDQLELNKMLKSKNFSASKLMSHRGVLSEAQTFRKPAPSVQIQVNYIKKPIFQSEPAVYNPKLNIHILKAKGGRSAIVSGNSSAERINFYESDLLQIGNSMQS